MGREQTWRERFVSIVDLFQKVDWGARTRDIYQQVATNLLDVVQCDSVSIRLLSSAGDEMIGYVYAGEADAIVKKRFPTLPVDVGRMSTLFEELKPIVYDFHAPQAGDVKSAEGVDLGYGHAVSVPLIAHDSLVGAVDFMYKRGRFDEDPETVLFLTELCKVLGPISSALSTSEEMLELRVSEETKRIGSELHDNFAQPLSVIVLEADKASLAQEDGDDEQLSESLGKICALGHQSFDLMTDEIALLHSAAGTSEDLAEDVERYVREFRGQWGLDISLDTPDKEVLVSKSVGNQAMRILHEALSNVLRHARADHVSVKMASSQGAIGLTIEDNGCGFDTNARPTRKLGLRVMEERAKSVGGRVTIASVMDEGTSVIADLPLIA